MTERIIKKLKEKEKESKRKRDKNISRQRNKTVSNVRTRGDQDQNFAISSRNMKGNKSTGQFLRKSNREKNNDNGKKIDLKYLTRTPRRESKSKSFYTKTDARTDIETIKRMNEKKLITNLIVKRREDKSKSKGKNLVNKRESKKEEKKIEVKNNISKRPSKYNIREKDKKDIKKEEKSKLDIKNKIKGKERIEDKKDNKNKDINKKRENKIKEIKKEEKKFEKKLEGKKEEKKEETKVEEKNEKIIIESKKEEKKIIENNEGTKNDGKKEDNKDRVKNNDLKIDVKKENINVLKNENNESKTEGKEQIKSENNMTNIEEQLNNSLIEKQKNSQKKDDLVEAIKSPQNSESSNKLFNKIISCYGKIINYLNDEEKKNLLLISKDSANFIIKILKEINQKQLKESENALNQFKSKNKEEEYIGEIPQFQLSRTGLKILEKLNEENNQKLFTSEEIPNKDIILIYRLFLQLVNKDKDINIKNIKDEDFWKIAKDKIFINKKGQFGEHIKEMINEIDFSCENLETTSDISKNYMDKLNAKYISNLSQTTGMFFVLIREIFDYCGIFENKKTSLAIEYRRLEFKLKKNKEKEERLQKIIDITQKNV